MIKLGDLALFGRAVVGTKIVEQESSLKEACRVVRRRIAKTFVKPGVSDSKDVLGPHLVSFATHVVCRSDDDDSQEQPMQIVSSVPKYCRAVNNRSGGVEI